MPFAFGWEDRSKWLSAILRQSDQQIPNLKLQIPNKNQIQIPKVRNSRSAFQIVRAGNSGKIRLSHLNFEHSSLFRISDFDIRI
jgi:hypothetical protein